MICVRLHRLFSGAILLLVLTLGARPALSLNPNRAVRQYLVDSWQVSAGLPQNNIKAILQTRDGYLWIATKGGLARFDGKSFITFSDHKKDQLQESEVWSIIEDNDGALWIGTYGGGLSRYQGGRFTTHRKRDGLPGDYVSSLARSADGALWIGTERGLGRLKDGQLAKLTTNDGLPHNDIRALHVDRDDVLWIGTRGGLARLQSGRITNLALRHPGLLDRAITSLVSHGTGDVWAGTSGVGAVRIRGDDATSFASGEGLASNTVNSMVIEEHGALWAGTDQGLCRFQEGRFSCYFSNLETRATTGVIETVSLRSIQSLACDREGSLWIGTNADGLARLRDGVFEQLGEIDGLPASDTRTVIEDSLGAIWVGTSNGLAWLSRGKTTVFTTANGLANNAISTVVDDRRGSIWVGTNKGLNRIRNGKVERVTAGGLDRIAIQTVTFDGQNNAWIGTQDSGVFRLRDGEAQHYGPQDGLLGQQVRAVALDAQGRLWYGTKDAGLFRFQGNRFSEVVLTPGAEREGIFFLLADGDDTLWVVTRRGLIRIKGNQISNLTVEHGLPTNFLYQLIDDRQGSLWFTHGNGIASAPKSALQAVADGAAKQVQCANYGTEHGLRSTALSLGRQNAAFRSRDGRLWFASARGVVIADPGHMPKNELPPPTWVEEIIVDGLSRGLPRGASFAPGRGDVEIHYTGLSFLAPDKVFFEYMLEGKDEKWIEAGDRRVAYYTNLGPRTYRFHVKACNNDGKWNDKGDVYVFTLRPHWYQTWLFYSFLLIAFAGLTFGSVHWRMQAGRARQAADRARRKADEERDLLHALMDNIPDLIYFKDAESRFTRVNAARAAALGLKTPEEATGKSEDSFHDAEYAREVQETERELLTTGQALTGRVEHEARSGRFYLVTKVPLKDKTGRVTGLVGISKDITERKEAEEKLEKDLVALLNTVKEIAQGDLMRRGREGDDTLGRIARSVNQMLEGFSSILTEVRDAAFSVSTSSAEILAAAGQIAKGARYGSDEVNATSAAVEEMTASMARVTENSEESAASAQRVLEHARSGEQAVNATVQGMARIDESVSETAEKMHLLEQRSKQVFEIIRLIEEIASQSTLLSLNAAIEAAHAGDAGRGFGVVAEEIRRLADRSTGATKDVTAIVEGMVEETRAVLTAMERGLSEVHAGHELTERAEKSLGEIGALVQKSAHLATDISRASREQLRATQTVAQAVHSISGVTQESAAGATETTRAVQDLVNLSDHLIKAISLFKIDSGNKPQQS